MIGQKLLQLDWEVLIHPLHSPAIAPLGFYLFRSLQNSLNGNKTKQNTQMNVLPNPVTSTTDL